MKQILTNADPDVVTRCRAITKPGSYAILPRVNRVMSQIPGLVGVDAQVLATPQIGARFTQHELLVQPGGKTIQPIIQDLEQFVFVLEGELSFTLDSQEHAFSRGGFAWLPPGAAFAWHNPSANLSRVLWLRRRYLPHPDLLVPAPIISNETQVQAFPEDTYMEQHLIPYENTAFDMAMNVLNFDPGVYFSAPETHIMEHGLYMLSGRGIYWLNGDLYEVQQDDFIYMAPYCPQFFYAMGWQKGRYLIYKDVNRDYIEGL